MKEIIAKVEQGYDLFRDEAFQAVSCMLENATNQEIERFLLAMNRKEITVDELVGSAEGMRDKSEHIYPKSSPLVDTCGTGGASKGIDTGGDFKGTGNVSTCAAVVAAAAGVKIAKHGNYKVTSSSGSANILESLGVNIHRDPEYCEQMIDEVGFAFLFAQKFHPAMIRVAEIRRKLKVRTIFNLIGPLCNPANADAQLLGVYDEGLCEKFYQALIELKVKRAMVVYGSGLDEITNTGPTTVYEVNNGSVSDYVLTPEELGFKRCSLKDIAGKSPSENAKIFKRVLAGEKGPIYDIIVINAGAAIYLSGIANTLREGIDIAKKAILSGAAQEKLEQIIRYSNS